MGNRAAQDAATQEAATRQYIQQVTATSTASPADQVDKLADLEANGSITDVEYAALKAKALAS